MVKKTKPKAGAKPKTAARPATRAKAAAKYDQPGAPWWKKMPLPAPKGS